MRAEFLIFGTLAHNGRRQAPTLPGAGSGVAVTRRRALHIHIIFS
jgi:hypothetical protein